jgi:hypothetical protein
MYHGPSVIQFTTLGRDASSSSNQGSVGLSLVTVRIIKVRNEIFCIIN